MSQSTHADVLKRIHAALEEARQIFSKYTPGKIAAEDKARHDPVTAADKELDASLRKALLRSGEGWLSEESADDLSRLRQERVWVVDPLDGTRELVAGIPEFCVSIAYIENDKPVAGGILNPASSEVFVGSRDSGITYNGKEVRASTRADLAGATMLASRSETARGEWERFRQAPFRIQPMGSVAYKLARVAAGLADATFTLSPKHEWDIAGGAALVTSAGGHIQLLDGSELICNRESTLVPGLIACGPRLKDELLQFLSDYLVSSTTSGARR
jgi:myo-inositol-1(or 4)-monophosphatase